MKTTKLLSFIILFSLIAPAFAGKKHKGGRALSRQQQAPQPPSTHLGQFLSAHLDHVLAPLDQRVALPRTELMQLRESFTDQWSRASQPEKAPYQAAIVVCDALSQAMDERDKAVAASQPSNIVRGVQDTHDATVSIPRGRWRGRAADAAVRQQKYQNQKSKNQAAQKDAFLNSNIAKQWLNRAVLLRQNIQQLYSWQRDAERKAENAKTAPISAAPMATP